MKMMLKEKMNLNGENDANLNRREKTRVDFINLINACFCFFFLVLHVYLVLMLCFI